MPNELFRDSDKSVITCILVFDAHRPHDSSKTWFGFGKMMDICIQRPTAEQIIMVNMNKKLKNIGLTVTPTGK